MKKLPDENELRHLFLQEQMSLSEIARKFNVSRQAVHSRFRSLGILTRRPEPNKQKIINSYQNGQSLARIAAANGIDRLTVRRILVEGGVKIRPRPGISNPTFGIKFSDDQVARIVAEYKAGDSMAVIGRRHGIYPSKVWRVLKAQGIRTRPRGPSRQK